MENVKGILTKEGGKVREMILQEIRSIIDLKEFHQLIHFVANLKKSNLDKQFILDCYLQRLNFEKAIDKDLDTIRKVTFRTLKISFGYLHPKLQITKQAKRI
jgi:DNA (cytosine-5)-methyltransferase 1